MIKNAYLCRSIESLNIKYLETFYTQLLIETILIMIFYATKRQITANPLHAFKVLMFIIALAFCMPITLHSKPITAQQAFKIAQKYLQLPAKQLTRSGSINNKDNQVAPFYVYNDTRNKGFVIVSGNTEMGEILAYSTESTFEEQSVNPGAQLLLNAYQEAFKAVSTGKHVVGATRAAAQNTTVVKPLLKTYWGQGDPYSQKTGYNYTGCVATAIAQVMKYHEWPVQGQGESEYTVSFDRSKKYANFAESHYDWANMVDRYGYYDPSTPQQKEAVALLMRDCGYALKMQYSENVSSSTGYSALYALKNNFQYDAVLLSKFDEGIGSFVRIIKKELTNGFPLYIEGMPEGGRSGHAWVLDGVDKNGLFHMNFGWNGQSNGYYSLTALSVLKAGSEFQGRSLAFNRQLKVIVAHPKKPGVIEIDKSLLPESPKLKFNEGSYITLKNTTQRTFQQNETLPVSYASFVNIGRPFKGDIGIAVLDNTEKVVKEFYSDHHNNGGFTHSIYADYDDLMGTDHLIANAQTIKVKLSDLKDGYYTLKPVCYQRNDTGDFEPLTFMKMAPDIEVEISKGQIRVTKECGPNATYQLVQHLEANQEFEQGTTAKIQLLVQSLQALPKTVYAKIKLIDKNNKVALEQVHNKAVEFDGFDTLELPFSLNIPDDFAMGTYSIEVEMLQSLNPAEGEESLNNVVKVSKVHGNETTTLVISKQKPKPLMSSCNVSFAESSETKLITNELLFSKYPLFKLIVDLKTFPKKSYNGPIELFFEDITTKERIAIAANQGAVAVNSDYNFEFYSYWLRPSTLGIEENKTYKLVVLGTIDGVKTDLWNNELPPCFFIKTNEKLTMSRTIPTAINSNSIDNASLQLFFNNKEIKLEGHNLQWIELYSLSGELLKKVQLGGNSEAIVNLNEAKTGVYIAKIKVNNTTITRKVLIH